MTILREHPHASSQVLFDLSHQDLVHWFAFHQSSDVWVNGSRFPKACSSSDSRWCLCVEFQIWVSVHPSIMRSDAGIVLCQSFAEFHAFMQLAIACFMNVLRSLSASLSAWTACLRNSSFAQLRLSDGIGSKFHICNFALGFPRIA